MGLWDLKRNADGDIEFGSSGELVTVSDGEELTQCVEYALGTRQGEWFLNPDIGLDFSLFLEKLGTEEERRAELSRAALMEERLDSVDKVEFTREGRHLTVKFDASGGVDRVGEVVVDVG